MGGFCCESDVLCWGGVVVDSFFFDFFFGRGREEVGWVVSVGWVDCVE